MCFSTEMKKRMKGAVKVYVFNPHFMYLLRCDTKLNFIGSKKYTNDKKINKRSHILRINKTKVFISNLNFNYINIIINNVKNQFL